MKEVDEYIAQLTGAGSENAYHCLIDYAGNSDVGAYLISVFSHSSDPHLQYELLEVLKYFRDPAAIPFFVSLLSTEHWCQSLDGLVAIGSSEALRALRIAAQSEVQAPEDWLAEAIEQIEDKE